MFADVAPHLAARTVVSARFCPRHEMIANIAPFLAVSREVSTRFCPCTEIFDDVAPFLPHLAVPGVLASTFVATITGAPWRPILLSQLLDRRRICCGDHWQFPGDLFWARGDGPEHPGNLFRARGDDQLFLFERFQRDFHLLASNRLPIVRGYRHDRINLFLRARRMVGIGSRSFPWGLWGD